MLAEIFMFKLETLRRPETTTTPSSSAFVPFDRTSLGSFKGTKPRR
jgi:hypothetical protein